MNKRKIYTHNHYIKYFLINGTIGEIKRLGELRYLYGEVPEDSYELYNDGNTIELFDALLRETNYRFLINQTLLKKRIYIFNDMLTSWRLEGVEKLYKDELLCFYVVDEYDIVEKPSNRKLQEDLNFYDYTQLIFDREQQLKEMFFKENGQKSH